jgi:lipopolysaccharide/colanic/teichoic acid biosynthesis glycosyltransferase
LALAVKRAIDVGGASMAALVLSPALACVALAVAATQGLPVLFRQQRPGLNGVPFTIYKFRTMRSPRRGEVWYLTDNERITRLGRFLRGTSLDELPELWNVLRGDMSLVGPRPLLMEYLEKYTPEERRRHAMRPGITGWAAVNGRNALQFKDRLQLDAWYVDKWSLALDARILAMTAIQVLRRTDVSTTEDLALGFPLPGVDVGPAGQPDAAGPPDRRLDAVAGTRNPNGLLPVLHADHDVPIEGHRHRGGRPGDLQPRAGGRDPVAVRHLDPEGE